MRKTEFSILVSLILSVILCSFSAFASECENLNENVLRLHVIANDDSESEQNLKLKVRDAILQYGADIFGKASDKESAVKLSLENLENIKAVCEEVLRENGSSHSVDVEITRMFFNTRRYENFTLPCGEYDALRVTIGEGKGKNWWCVMFPPMCISACVDREELTAVLGENGETFIEKSPKYTVRFKLLEWAKSLFTKAEKYEK